MKFTLKRTECGAFGQFGILLNESGDILAYTLERAYPVIDQFCPKVPAGTYTCKLGDHQLSTGPKFKTYELQDVPNHSGILIHQGNTQTDSHGCILVGSTRGELNGVPAVRQSAIAFAKFMDVTGGAPEITLEVLG